MNKRQAARSSRRPWPYRDLWWLLFLSLGVRLASACFIRRPGYMDVAYYAANALQLSRGGGLQEPFLWNYLNDPMGLPQPAFLYWMPLPSLLAAPFAVLFPGSFFALQIPFIILSALLPLVAYVVAWEVVEQRRTAWLTALLTLFSGLFFPFWTLPETFAPFALFGSLALWLAGRRLNASFERRQASYAGRWLVIGLLVGLAHLTRADGILLLPVVALALGMYLKTHGMRCMRFAISGGVFLILGYLLAMGPWFVRNYLVIGAPLSSVGTKTIWLTTYDDIFCYDCEPSFHTYLAWGWENILDSKLSAMWINLQHFVAEACQVFLLPFISIGLYRLRRRLPTILAAVYLISLYVVHSLVFTFPGWRGSFFHASGVLLPFLYLAAIEGLDEAVSWLSRRRRWKAQQARTVFAAASVVGAILISLYGAAQKLPGWWNTRAVYREVGAWLEARGVVDGTRVMVNNPPGFYYHTGISAVVVPNSDIQTLVRACERYDVDYLLLDANRPGSLKALYEGQTLLRQLTLVATFEESRLKMWKVVRQDG